MITSYVLGQAYLSYREYLEDMEKQKLTAVDFFNFLIGKR